MMVLTGFLKSFMYIAQQSSNIQKLHKLAFFFTLVRIETNAYAVKLDKIYTYVSYITGQIYKSKFPIKLNLGDGVEIF